MKKWEVWDWARDYYWIEYQRLPAVMAKKNKQRITRNKFNKHRIKGLLDSASNHLCFECHAPARSYHHLSYELGEEFDVLPLCLSCHSESDKVMRRLFRQSLPIPSLSDFYHAVLNCIV